MIILPAKEFNMEWIHKRKFLCHLPTQIVMPCYYTGEMIAPRLNTAYCYQLDSKLFPPKEEKHEYGRSWHYQNAVEIHEDCGDDGHTDFEFMRKFVLLYANELPKNFLEYRDMLDKLHEYEWSLREEKHKQLMFSDYRYNFNY